MERGLWGLSIPSESPFFFCEHFARLLLVEQFNCERP